MINRVIFNADDYGLTSGITRAIIESHRNGVVMSTTILGNCDDKLLVEAADLAKQNPGLGVGAHLVLTTRKPLLPDHKTLVDAQGFFSIDANNLNDSIDPKEVYSEWKAQILRLKEHFELTHLDSHHHVHLDNRLNKVARRLSREFKLPMRSVRENLPTEVRADLGFYGKYATLDHLQETMNHYNGTLEFMVHPGQKDDVFLEEISSYSQDRYQELQILTSKELSKYIKDKKIKIVNYRAIVMK